MKLLVFAPLPPLAGDSGIRCYQVGNGPVAGASYFRLFFGCLRAIWVRFRHGVKNFYFVPAAGGRAPVQRDWLVLLLCRPFFTNVIFHWQAHGLARWLETTMPIRTRSIAYRLMRDARLSIIESDAQWRDAKKMLPLRIAAVVPARGDYTGQLAECLRSSENPAPPGTLKLALSILAENPARKTGLSTMFHELVSRSLKLFPDVSWLVFAGPTQDWRVVGPRVEVIRDFPANDHLNRRLLADHFQVPRVARDHGASALLTVGFVPIRKSLPIALHVLSLQTLDKRNQLGFMRGIYRNSMVKYNWPQADLVITNSNWTAGQISRLDRKFDANQITSYEGLQHEVFNPVTGPAEASRLRELFGLEPGYVLWISNFYPYKQAELLIGGYARLAPDIRRRHPLVMVGGNWLNGLDSARACAKECGVADDIRFPGWVHDSMLAPLYRHAAAFCLASREETFGRCVIEAMACGTPCVVNDIPIMREVTAGHALVVNFHDPGAVAGALEKLMGDDGLRSQLRADGLQRARDFTFEKLVTERILAIRKMVEARKKS